MSIFNKTIIHKSLTYLIATVWLINGLYCKILQGVPRHQEIVARILGENHAGMITVAIGVLEVFMVIWIISRIQPKLNAITQITIILIMNIIEFILARDLLLFGYANFCFAILFAAIIYVNEFHLNTHYAQS